MILPYDKFFDVILKVENFHKNFSQAIEKTRKIQESRNV